MGIEKQTALFDEYDPESAKEVRCRRCGKVLSNPRSIKNRCGSDCLRELKEKDWDEPAEALPVTIDNDLLKNIYYWCEAMLRSTKSANDRELVLALYTRAKSCKNMSPVLISSEIDAVIELYNRLDIIRDDILFGLNMIAEATGKEIGV